MVILAEVCAHLDLKLTIRTPKYKETSKEIKIAESLGAKIIEIMIIEKVSGYIYGNYKYYVTSTVDDIKYEMYDQKYEDYYIFNKSDIILKDMSRRYIKDQLNDIFKERINPTHIKFVNSINDKSEILFECFKENIKYMFKNIHIRNIKRNKKDMFSSYKIEDYCITKEDVDKLMCDVQEQEKIETELVKNIRKIKNNQTYIFSLY